MNNTENTEILIIYISVITTYEYLKIKNRYKSYKTRIFCTHTLTIFYTSSKFKIQTKMHT